MRKMQQLKKSLRDELKKSMKSMNQDSILKDSICVTNLVTKSDVYSNAKSIALFVSMKHEINTYPLIKHCFDDNKKVYLPLCIKMGEMIMLSVNDYNELNDDGYFTKSKYGIWEPNIKYKDINGNIIERENVFDTLDLDLIIVPGLGFNDKKGTRIGYGGGFYDRFLSKYNEYLIIHNQNNKTQLKMPYLMGIGLHTQYCQHIPTQSHDWTLNEVILAPTLNDNINNNETEVKE